MMCKCEYNRNKYSGAAVLLNIACAGIAGPAGTALLILDRAVKIQQSVTPLKYDSPQRR